MNKVIFITVLSCIIFANKVNASAPDKFKFVCEYSEGHQSYQTLTIEPFLSDMQCTDEMMIALNGKPFHSNWKCVDGHFRMPTHGLSQMYTEPWGDTVFLRSADHPVDIVLLSRWALDDRGNDVFEDTYLKCQLVKLKDR